MENLERARSVNKRRAWTSHERRPDRDAVAISRIVVVQREDRLESAGKIQQLPNRDPGFARIVSPRGNGVANVLVEAEQTILDRGERRQSPKRFGAAVNLVRLARFLFEQRLSVLDGEK